MEVMNQLQAKLRRAQFRIAHPVIVTEQHVDPAGSFSKPFFGSIVNSVHA
jgi:hypothetical protein